MFTDTIEFFFLFVFFLLITSLAHFQVWMLTFHTNQLILNLRDTMGSSTLANYASDTTKCDCFFSNAAECAIFFLSLFEVYDLANFTFLFITFTAQIWLFRTLFYLLRQR